MQIYWSQLPLLRIVLPFSIGIIIHFYNSDYWLNHICYGAVVLGIIFLLNSSRITFKYRYLYGLILHVLFCSLGFIYSSLSYEIRSLKELNFIENHHFIAKVYSIETNEKAKQKIGLQIGFLKKKSVWVKWNEKVIAYPVNSNFQLKVGDLVLIEGRLTKPRKALNPYAFDYSKYLKKKGIRYLIYVNKALTMENHESIKTFFLNIKTSIINDFEKSGISGDELAVLKALTLGDKSDLNFNLKQAYTNAGVMHVLAVSGLHVGIIFLILNQFLGFMDVKYILKWVKTILILAVVWSFALLTGFTPSVQRASWMFSFIILAKAMKRNSSIINSISASAFLLMLFEPYVIFDLGFQLSYSAVLGIVLIYPIVYPMILFRSKLMSKVWGLSLVSLSAQLATLPISIYYFHQFPNLFLAMNLFVIPIAFIVVLLSLSFAVSSLFLGKVDLIGMLLEKVISLLNKIILLIEGIPFSTTQNLWILPISAISLLIAVSLIVLYMYSKKFRHLFGGLIVLLIIVLIEIVGDLKQLDRKFISIYSFSPFTISFVNGFDATVFSINNSLDNYAERIVRDHLNAVGVRNISFLKSVEQFNEEGLIICKRTSSTFIQYQDKLLAYFNGNIKNDLITSNYQFDIVVLNRKVYIDDIKCIVFKDLIFDNSIPLWSNFHLDLEKRDNIHLLNKSGYLEFSL